MIYSIVSGTQVSYVTTLELVMDLTYSSGAYTNQMCTIDPAHGNSLVHLGEINSTQPGNSTPPTTWYYNYTITNGTSALVDGAKRDRLVWAGGMCTARLLLDQSI